MIKLRLVTSLYNLNQIEYLLDLIDYALVNVPKLSIHYENINIDDAINLLKKNNKGIILNINRIMHDSDLDLVDSLFNKYLNDNEILFQIADLGVLNIAKKLKIENRIIYNPETMVTNYLDLEIYNSFNINAVGISSEITLNDVILMKNHTNNIFYQLFGLRLMFYSKRRLITLYGNKNNEIYPKEAFLKETTRNDYFPIYENENGTYIYRGYNINYLSDIDKLDFIKYGYIESLNLKLDDLKAVLAAFNDTINNYEHKAINVKKINDLGINIADGFKYKDSVYQKEELKNG